MHMHVVVRNWQGCHFKPVVLNLLCQLLQATIGPTIMLLSPTYLQWWPGHLVVRVLVCWRVCGQVREQRVLLQQLSLCGSDWVIFHFRLAFYEMYSTVCASILYYEVPAVRFCISASLALFPESGLKLQPTRYRLRAETTEWRKKKVMVDKKK